MFQWRLGSGLCFERTDLGVRFRHMKAFSLPRTRAVQILLPHNSFCDTDTRSWRLKVIGCWMVMCTVRGSELEAVGSVCTQDKLELQPERMVHTDVLSIVEIVLQAELRELTRIAREVVR